MKIKEGLLIVDIRLKSALVTIAIIVFIALLLYAISTFEIFAIISSVVFYTILIAGFVYIVYTIVYCIFDVFGK